MTLGIQQHMWELERVRNAFHEAVYVAHDVDAAMEATAPQCSLVNVPMMTGGGDRDAVRRHLAEDVVPHLPADLTFRRLARTVDKLRVVDEVVVEFTHDRELPWLLPGAPPTLRRAEVLAVTVVTLRQMHITTLRTLWDHSDLLSQLGLDARSVRPGEVARWW